MFRNRVTPFGSLIKTKARGAWLGNRGVIHNPQQDIVRPFKLKAWITCALQFKGRHREIMQPDRWTELFFLDEATALSAGHRPCFECRRTDADRFKFFWLKANPQYGFNKKTSIKEIDTVLHKERICRGEKVTYRQQLNRLPDGVFIEWNDTPFLIRDGMLHPWTAYGYETPIAFPHVAEVKVLTPESIVNMIGAGFVVES